MANSYGEGFKQPLDFETLRPIPGSPHMARVGHANSTKGTVILRPETQSTDLYGTPTNPPRVDQPRVSGGGYD